MLKPFIKWVGGKTQLLTDIYNNLPENKDDITTYIEPFIGGGSVLFNISKEFKSLNTIIINDLNTKLIYTYKSIKEQPDIICKKLKILQETYYNKSYEEKEKYYYEIRNEFNNNINIDSNFIFLNKTGFNGLYRENKAGMFNTPWNKSKTPCIYDEENIYDVSEFLNKYNIIILNDSYSNVLNNRDQLFNKRTFIYMDPPYRPITKSSAFTAYTKSGFNDESQKQLKTFCDILNNKGCYWLLSNSDPKNSDINDNFFDDLYNEYNIIRVNAKRNINSKGDKRGNISELLIKNY